MNPDTFFAELLERSREETSIIAVLRRSASYDPGLYPPAFPCIEPYVHGLSEWQRKAVYLVAACWAQSPRRAMDSGLGQSSQGLSLAVALRTLRAHQLMGSKNIDQRFVALLDADPDELQWRLRHVTSQLSAAGIAIDWAALLKDLWAWNSAKRYIQIDWARKFWAPDSTKSKSTPTTKSPA